MKRNESAVELRRGSGPDPDTLMFFDGHREAYAFAEAKGKRR